MKAKRTYKDSLFRHMFKHKRRITHLYAALSRNHVDPRDIMFRTLRGTFFNDVKNDISFLVENRMVILLEQQSTCCGSYGIWRGYIGTSCQRMFRIIRG